MKKAMLILGIAVVFSLGLYVQVMAADFKVTLRYTDQNPEAGLPSQTATLPLLLKITEATEGKVQFETYFSSTLTNARDTWDSITKGIANAGWVSLPHYPGKVPLTDVMGLPGLPYRTGADRAGAMWLAYEKYPEMQAEYEKGGLKPLIFFSTDPYSLMTKKPVRNLNDLKSMKIRTLGGPATQQMKLLGGVPILQPMPDVYISLQKGVLDGISTAAEAIVTWRFFEVAGYITPAPLPGSYLSIAMSDKQWKTFPAEVQAQIMSVCGYEGSRWYSDKFFDNFVPMVTTVAEENGKKVEYIELAPEEWEKWVELSKPAVDSWIEANSAKGLGEVSQKIYNDMMNNFKN